ncbi:shaker-related potassium channel tsha2-like isoform X2 [Bolinopsis microptera]|uniref:shaker-related potassium channel tsha2-like isoform X2 n=1 Tax=Bolinopsis microptera TaxID=2820187 RepID=UPI0030791F6F
MPMNVGVDRGRNSLGHINLGARIKSKTITKIKTKGDNAREENEKVNLRKKSLLWRGSMVEVLLGRDIPERVPIEVRLDCKNAKLVKIDCGGEMFITTEQSLSRYPNTLLGDPDRRAAFYDAKTSMYYFDRNQDLFNAILYFYQSPGTFRPPEMMDPVVVEEELDFFGIDLDLMIKEYDRIYLELHPELPPTLKETINKTITDPSYNKAGMVWGFMDLACIIMTISLLVIETIPAFHDHFKKPFAKDEITGQIQPYKMATYMLDVVINLFFTVDLIIKFLSSKNRKRFFLNTVNVMDILAVSPFYLELLVFIATGGEPSPHFFALKVCRIVRVVRVLKLVRHSRQLTEVLEVVSSAKQEFIVLIGVVGVVILLVGTIMYFVEFQIPDEGDENVDFKSILHGCWWAIVTITTVGYGDLFPKSSLGKLTGSFVVLFGIVVLAFPMTIIISKFQDSFTIKKLIANKEMTRKLREMAISGYLNSYNSSQIMNGKPKAHVPRKSVLKEGSLETPIEEAEESPAPEYQQSIGLPQSSTQSEYSGPYK